MAIITFLPVMRAGAARYSGTFLTSNKNIFMNKVEKLDKTLMNKFFNIKTNEKMEELQKHNEEIIAAARAVVADNKRLVKILLLFLTLDVIIHLAIFIYFLLQN